MKRLLILLLWCVVALFAARAARFTGESALRKIAREPRWDRQRELFEQRLRK
jgi:hypothetical protein